MPKNFYTSKCNFFTFYSNGPFTMILILTFSRAFFKLEGEIFNFLKILIFCIDFILNNAKTIIINLVSASAISTSNEQICSKLEEENKCYQNLSNYLLKRVCLNSTAENDISILKYCGTLFPTAYETRLCPKISISKYSFHQCYNTAHLGQER